MKLHKSTGSPAKENAGRRSFLKNLTALGAAGGAAAIAANADGEG